MSKSISGSYLDNQNFIHTVFYNKSNRNYVKTIRNKDGKFCSSSEYTKEQINNQLEGMTRGFSFMGDLFFPVGKTGLSFIDMSKRLGKEVISGNAYTHSSFYEIVRKNRVPVVDLYKMIKAGKTIIPCSKTLFEWLG